MVDTKNAHVRPEKSKRQATDVQANEAKRLLNDPAYMRGFDMVRDGLIHSLEQFKHSGSKEDDDWEREVCRSLRTLISTRRAMSAGVQGQILREAGFRAVAPDSDELKEG
jgi:hypothetical protein